MKLILVTLALVLTSCSSSVPKTHYYLLSPDMGPYEPVVASRAGYFIETVVLPDHLNQQALTMFSGSHEVQVASYHYWAQPLSQGIAQVAGYELNRRCACEIRSSHQGDRKIAEATNLRLFIDQMSVSDSGKVVLSGMFELDSEKRQRFYFTEQLQQPGYEQAIAVQRKLLAKMTQQVLNIDSENN